MISNANIGWYSKHPETIVKIIRSSSVFYIILWYFIGVLFSNSFSVNNYLYIITAISFFFTYSSGNILNDYFDRDIDRTANKKRPLQIGDISELEMIRGYYIFMVSGLIVGAFAGYFIFAVNLLIVLIGIIYSHPVFSIGKKGFSATLLMVLGYHIVPFLSGYFRYSKSSSISVPVMYLFFGFLLLRFSRLLMKDYEDYFADSLHNKITPLHILGGDRLFYLIFIFATSGTILVCFSYLNIFLKSEAFLLFLLTVVYYFFTIYSAYFSGKGNQNKIGKFRKYSHLCIFTICLVMIFSLV